MHTRLMRPVATALAAGGLLLGWAGTAGAETAAQDLEDDDPVIHVDLSDGADVHVAPIHVEPGRTVHMPALGIDF